MKRTAEGPVRTASILLFLGALIGCSSGSPLPPFVVVDSSGVRIAENSAPAAEHVRWNIPPVPVLRIGEVSGKRELTFDQVDDATLKRDGTVIIADRRSNEIRFFDRDGRYLSTLGGYGNGPGEFRDIRGIELIDGGLFVFDAHHRRFTLFDESGKVVSTTAVAETGITTAPLSTYRLVGLLEEDHVLLRADRFIWDSTPTAQKRVMHSPTLLYSLEGAQIAQVAEPMVSDVFSNPDISVGMGFTRVGSVSVHQGRIFASDGGSYEFRRYAASNEPDFITRVLRDPRPVTAEDLDGWYTEGRGFPGREYREFKPWIRDIKVDELGYVWALEYEQRWKHPNRWSIFDPDGRWLGTIQTPPRFRVIEIGEAYILGVLTDEQDVEYVVIYGLERGGDSETSDVQSLGSMAAPLRRADIAPGAALASSSGPQA